MIINSLKKKKGTATEIDQIAGAIFKEYRIQTGLIQIKVAKDLNLSFQQLQKYETGKNRMNLGFLVKAFALLKIDAQEFFEKIILRAEKNSFMEKRDFFTQEDENNDINNDHSNYEENYNLQQKDILRFMNLFNKLNKVQKKKIVSLVKSMIP